MNFGDALGVVNSLFASLERCCVHNNNLSGNHSLIYHLFGKIVCLCVGSLDTVAVDVVLFVYKLLDGVGGL